MASGPALTASGRVRTTLDRRRALLAVAEDRAAAEPDNLRRHRDLATSHHKLGHLAVTIGTVRTAGMH